MFLLTGSLALLVSDAVAFFSVLIFIALISGFLGDFFLSCKNEKYFSIGVLFFAAGHIIYSFAFMGNGAIPGIKESLIPVFSVFLLALILFIVIKAAGISLKKKKIFIPYVFILFLFFSSGIMRGILSVKEKPLLAGCLFAGSLLFVFSDIILGIRLMNIKLPPIFRHAVSYAYFPAQTFLAMTIFFF